MRRELEMRITIPDDEDPYYLTDTFIQALEAQVAYFKEIKPMAGSGRLARDEWVNQWITRVW